MIAKFGKEFMIGLVALVSILLFIFGLKFLSGKKVFSSEKGYYAYYQNVQGLQESAEVQINGKIVGKVSSVVLQKDMRILVHFTTNKNISLPIGTVAKLVQPELISNAKIIDLFFDISNANHHVSGDTLTSEEFGSMLSSFSSEIDPILNTAKNTIATIDTFIQSIQQVFNPTTQEDLAKSISSLSVSLKEFEGVAKNLNAQSKNIDGIMTNVNSFSNTLKANNDKISQTLNNLNELSDQLANANIKQTLLSLQATSDNLSAITKKLESDDGSLGLMLNDKEFYNNLTKTMSSLDVLLDDLKKNPARYINVSVFGRKGEPEQK